MPITTTITPLETYRNERPYPFCPGCGHGPILDHLNAALVRLELDPRSVVLVSDIGCSGLSDQYFATSAFHGLHGRSITYATGIKLARPDLTVIVLMGDGGAGIGGAHLISAARRNIGIKLLVLNNFNFGMTGGQHSVTTPVGAVTSTTPAGNLEQPLDLCGTVAVNGAGYVYRGTSFDRDLGERIAAAIDHPGFALLDIWELCTAYFLPRNQWSRRSLDATLDDPGLERGLIRCESVREYSDAYREVTADRNGLPVLPQTPLEGCFEARLDRRSRLVIAGSAGGRVGSAARLAARAAILSGLHAAQRSDYPVTVQSGHSVAELVLDREAIQYVSGERPDALAILSTQGLAKCGGYLERMTAADRVFVTPELADLEIETEAQVLVLDGDRPLSRGGGGGSALVFVAAMVARASFFPVEALRAAAALEPEARRAGLLEAIDAGERQGGAAETPSL